MTRREHLLVEHRAISSASPDFGINAECSCGASYPHALSAFSAREWFQNHLRGIEDAFPVSGNQNDHTTSAERSDESPPNGSEVSPGETQVIEDDFEARPECPYGPAEDFPLWNAWHNGFDAAMTPVARWERSRIEPIARRLFDAINEHGTPEMLGKGHPVRDAMWELRDAFVGREGELAP